MPNLNENYLKTAGKLSFGDHTVLLRIRSRIRKNDTSGNRRCHVLLCQCAGEALLEGSKEMMSADTFKGYGPGARYEDTRKANVDYYKRSGVEIDASAVFVSDGAKSDRKYHGSVCTRQCDPDRHWFILSMWT